MVENWLVNLKRSESRSLRAVNADGYRLNDVNSDLMIVNADNELIIMDIDME